MKKEERVIRNWIPRERNQWQGMKENEGNQTQAGIVADRTKER